MKCTKMIGICSNTHAQLIVLTFSVDVPKSLMSVFALLM